MRKVKENLGGQVKGRVGSLSVLETVRHEGTVHGRETGRSSRAWGYVCLDDLQSPCHPQRVCLPFWGSDSWDGIGADPL